MRKYLHIKLDDRSVETDRLEGEAVIRAGRYLIAKMLLERGAATVDLPVTVQGRLSRNAGSGTLNGGGESLRLRSSGGGVRLRSL